MTKFTPGPWRWWTSNSWRRLKRDDLGITQNVIEPFVARDGHPDLMVSEADMALIAAAPDLFEVVEKLDLFAAGILSKNFEPSSYSLNELFKKAKSALAKARGE